MKHLFHFLCELTVTLFQSSTVACENPSMLTLAFRSEYACRAKQTDSENKVIHVVYKQYQFNSTLTPMFLHVLPYMQRMWTHEHYTHM